MKKYTAIVLLCLMLCACGRQPAAPASEPVPETAVPETTLPEITVPETTAEPAVLPVVITKDPSGETLKPGGSTLFIAHADNASFVTWEFVSPEGEVYSVTDTMTRNPGLLLDCSKQDTVTLSSVPLSLNGWFVRARFDGPGGSATTDSALITVTKSEGAYDAVIARYAAALEHRLEGYSVLTEEYDVSEMIAYADHVGYARVDLDGNGVEELIVAGIGYDIPEEPVVYEIYTLEDGVPVPVLRSQARSRMFLMADNQILNEGSSGAAHSNFSIYRLHGSALSFLNGLYTTDTAADGSAIPITYFFTTSNPYGDPGQMSTDNSMEEKVALTLLNSWRGSICLPELCLIA